MTFIIGLVVGFLAGWLLFKRPEVASNFLTWLKSKIPFLGGSDGNQT